MLNQPLPFLALAAAFLLNADACNKADGGNKAAMTHLAQGKWVLEKLDGAPVDAPEGKTPYLVVDSTGTQVNGFTGCNRMFGPVRVSGDSIFFDRLASTRMYCEETHQLEDRFLAALHAARTFKLADQQWILSDGKDVAVFRKVDETHP
jgi:heat shock protein HslJ